MSIVGQDFAFVIRYIRNLRGGSQPILAQASDHHVYVVKFINNLQGPNVSFNESAGSELYRMCGLPVPSWKPLLVTKAFLDQNQACWMQSQGGPVRPDSGLCFGSRFLGENGRDLLEILPGTSFQQVRNRQNFWLAWLIDVYANHIDNRQVIYRRDSAGWLKAFFVDHGSILGGPNGELPGNLKASRYLDPRIYQNVSAQQCAHFQKVLRRLDVDHLWQQAEGLPSDWKTPSAQARLAECLCRLSSPDIFQGILDAMVEVQRKASEREGDQRQSDWKPPISVLFPGIQTAELERRLVANRTGQPWT